MRYVVQVTCPNEEFNAHVRKGTAASTIGRILEETRPESVYFTEYNGKRGALLVVDITEPSRIPAIAEPWFLQFNADVQFHVAMTPDELGRSNLDALAKKW